MREQSTLKGRKTDFQTMLFQEALPYCYMKHTATAKRPRENHCRTRPEARRTERFSALAQTRWRNSAVNGERFARQRAIALVATAKATESGTRHFRRCEGWAAKVPITTDRRFHRSGLGKPSCWSGWPDLNRRPRRPERRALPSCATPRIV